MFTLFTKKSGSVRIKRDKSMWDPMQHPSAPTHMQFSSDGQYIKTFTRDYGIVHWKLDREARKGEILGHLPDPDKVKWHGDPLIAGWDTKGLMQPEWDGTDLNQCSVTKDRRFIAASDDYGTVRLHTYPAVDHTACHEYRGHSSFVVGCTFLSDSSHLITTGGRDMGIFQWRLVEGPQEAETSSEDRSSEDRPISNDCGWKVYDESTSDDEESDGDVGQVLDHDEESDGNANRPHHEIEDISKFDEVTSGNLIDELDDDDQPSEL